MTYRNRISREKCRKFFSSNLGKLTLALFGVFAFAFILAGFTDYWREVFQFLLGGSFPWIETLLVLPAWLVGALVGKNFFSEGGVGKQARKAIPGFFGAALWLTVCFAFQFFIMSPIKLDDNKTARINELEEINTPNTNWLESVDTRRLDDVHFRAVVSSARADDRESLVALLKISRDQSHSKFSDASAEAGEILFGLSMPRETFVGQYSVSPLPATIELAKENYRSVPRIWKPEAIRYFWSRQEYPLNERLGFLADVIRMEKSSQATWLAMQLFKESTGVEFDFLDAEKYSQWIDEHTRTNAAPNVP